MFQIEASFQAVKDCTPLIDCITNVITVESMANALLAIGASPVMADVYEEINDFVTISDALLLNTGNMAPDALRAMHRGGVYANKLGKTVVYDPVGLGASELRALTAESLLRNVKMSAIRGNISEMRVLYGAGGATRGVDAAAADELLLSDTADLARKLAQRYDAVIAVSGAVDVLSDGTCTVAVAGGDPWMSRITGSGCISGAVCAAFLSVAPSSPLDAAIAAAVLMKTAGARARAKTNHLGLGSFHTAFIDALSMITPAELAASAQVNVL